MKSQKYLLWFANDHPDFRAEELQAIVSMLKIDVAVPTKIPEPFIVLELPSLKTALDIASRSVILRSIQELWADATDIDSLHSQLKSIPKELISRHFSPEKSFKIKVELFNNSQNAQEKLNRIEAFDYLPIEGKVRLKNPDMTLQYSEFYGLDPNNIPDKPFRVFFGRKISDGQRDIITALSLKERKFIGNTSMDAQLSLIMANLAKVMPGDLVFDPFVGTGSLLVSAAHFGAYVFGCDIDYLMLHGKTRPTRIQQRHKPRENESVRVNFEQYNLQSRYIDVLVADSSLSFWRDDLLLDSIITDPPYGIREATEKVGTKECPKPITEGSIAHYPMKIDYALPDILRDLMHFGAKHLKLGGRLVYWIPVFRHEYSLDKLPKHSCLNLVSNSEQVLSTYTSRRLLTYEKIHHPVNITEKEKVVQDESLSFRDKFFHQAEEKRQKERVKKAENMKIYHMKFKTDQT